MGRILQVSSSSLAFVYIINRCWRGLVESPFSCPHSLRQTAVLLLLPSTPLGQSWLWMTGRNSTQRVAGYTLKDLLSWPSVRTMTKSRLLLTSILLVMMHVVGVCVQRTCIVIGIDCWAYWLVTGICSHLCWGRDQPWREDTGGQVLWERGNLSVYVLMLMSHQGM